MKFIEARWHSSGGNDNPTRIVMHDAEYPEKITGAEDVAAYFQRVERKASAHYVADCDSVVQCVKGGDVAYHAPPNAHSIGIELCGYAKQTTEDWLDAYGIAMLRDQAAPLVRDLCATYGIPRVWLSVDDLLAGKHGITSHNNVSLAWHQSTHTDPGGNFPIATFMAWITDQENDVTPEEHNMLTDNWHRLQNLEAVATRDIDTLAPKIAEVLQAVKDNPQHGAGPGDVNADDAAQAVVELLAQKLGK